MGQAIVKRGGGERMSMWARMSYGAEQLTGRGGELESPHCHVD